MGGGDGGGGAHGEGINRCMLTYEKLGEGLKHLISRLSVKRI